MKYCMIVVMKYFIVVVMKQSHLYCNEMKLIDENPPC